ncbi:MAG: TetR/AcrR family transcriptional regulator [Flavobacteriaceae bacterium]|nr:TetR/AcrR family transcriptional regulator [Flavobacteriaceae bacterium]
MKTTQRKDQIISVASQLFKEKGYNAVSMRDIADALDMKAASLYNHIKGKQEILSTLILRVASEFTEGMKSVVNERSGSLQKIEKIIGIHIDITIANSEALAALNNDWMHLEGVDLTTFIRMREDYESNFRRIIKQGIAEGAIRPLHPEVILFSILSTLRTLYLWYERHDDLDISTLKKDTLEVLIKGIVKN